MIDHAYDTVLHSFSKKVQRQILTADEYEKVSLSVNKDNYAYRMYQKLGFQVIREQDEDYLMVLELQE